jgi:glycosyltransferase involved in cell wall biosynthesis
MRIAIFTDTYAPHVNGVARTLARLATALESRGYGARVFTVADPRAELSGDVIRWPGIPFWGYPELRLATPSTTSVVERLRAWEPTLVHVATPFGLGLAGARAANRLGVPVVSSYHTSFSEYARYYGLGAFAAPAWRFLRWFHNRTRRTYVPTRTVSDDLAARGFRNLRLWQRGIDADVFNPRWRSEELRRSWGANRDTIVIAYVGRLAKEKGVDVAIDAVTSLRARLADRRQDVVFVLVGDGPHEQAMRSRAPAGTQFLGRLTGGALSAAYASADVLLFPSTTDTFGNVLLEGMASRLAVVAADMPQSREVCGEAAEFFIPGNAADLGSRLARLVADRAAIARLRDDAFVNARTRSWDAVFDVLFADYYSVVRGHHADRHIDPPAQRNFTRGFEVGTPREATW